MSSGKWSVEYVNHTYYFLEDDNKGWFPLGYPMPQYLDIYGNHQFCCHVCDCSEMVVPLLIFFTRDGSFEWKNLHVTIIFY